MKKVLYNLPINDESYVVKKSNSPIVRQRREDGSPITVGNLTSLKPRDSIYISKGSLAENLPPATVEINADPGYSITALNELVKAFLNS